MLKQVAIERIELRIVELRFEDAFAQVVQDHDFGGPAQAAKGLFMQLGPDAGAGLEGEQPDAFAGKAESEDE